MAHGMGVVEYAILDESGGPNRRTAAKLQEAMTRSTMQKDGLPQAVEVVMATRTVSKRDQLVIIDVAGSGSGAAAA